MSAKVPGEKPGLLIHYTVDGEIQSTTDETLTPREILEDAGLDPATHYLARVANGRWQSFKDAPDTPIVMDEDRQFVSVDARA
ncbi:MAG: hypothetical protein HYS12_22855 [Planctomycetes bacterium]|nr:hypothetical protein [Planctomycetota bacterium]